MSIEPTSAQIIRRQIAAVGRTRAAERPPRILIIGNFGNGNTGDEALLARTLQELPTGARPRILSRNPRLVEWMHSVPSAPMGASRLIQEILWCDGVVVVGGGMFGAGLPPLVRVLPIVMWTLTLLGRDVVYLAVGVYPGVPRLTLAALRASTRRPGRISVRDRLSAETLGRRAAAPQVGDLAYDLVPASEEAGRRVMRAAGLSGKPLLLISLKALPEHDRMQALLDAAARAVVRWRTHGGEAAVLCLSTHADYGFGMRYRDAELAAALQSRVRGQLPLLGPQLEPALAKAIVGQATAVFGLRLHAMIFAVSMGVECFGLAWEEKATAFLRDAGCPVRPLEEIEQWIDDLALVPKP